MAEIGIKVSVRCRPFTIDDELGVIMTQTDEEAGDVELINCEYTKTRFPFQYCWWTGYGYQRHLKGKNMSDADNMKLVDQQAAYDSVGNKIKADLLAGNAVVIFAYGLSGSGKTFTVFGPDAIDAPEAWFKHGEPQPLWGILPRMAYEIFRDKKDNWKISMKYFQNVVDIVRDLMSKTGEERSYKDGMRKDPDGFMDIEWCTSEFVKTWDEFRETFKKSNARKAIAPTQFNPMSTRGHCIMVLEVEIPDEAEPEIKQRGRVYICDLAGTEPAGDIVYATYEKENFDDGSFEYKYKGPHPDKKKTKELQDQGKKINLSLSEMAQFFMKMAEAVKAKKLKPGMTIPGCNTFFLCKYLKDTMLQAKTYLFCAIRPEKTYLKYTFATLGFATNASVLKLQPKKATVAGSAAERKLMAELEAMKALVDQLKNQKGSGDGDQASTIADLQAKLASKEGEAESGANAEAAQNEAQREEYKKRGILMAAYDGETNTEPYFSNLDSDAFRSDRFMYVLEKEETSFGPKGDVQLMSLSVVKGHATVKKTPDAIFVTPGRGEVWHNGSLLPKDKESKVEVFDRIAMGDQLMMLRWPGKEDGLPERMSGEDAVDEFQEGMLAHRAGGGGNNSDLDEERRKLMEEREKWNQEKGEMQSQRDEEEYQRAMSAIDNQILDLLPKTKEAKQTVDLLNRVTMAFDVVLEKGQDGVPRVKISVQNEEPKLSILMEPAEFLSKLSLLKDELMKLRTAIDSGREYECPERHDPLYLMFDNDFHLGTATSWPEYLGYALETEEDELMQEVKNAAVPYNNVGYLEVQWTPLAGPNEEDVDKEVADYEPDDLLGKPWTYKLDIKKATGLPVFCEMAYVSYDFFDETCVTEAVQQNTYSPQFDYSRVHHIPSVTPEFVTFLKSGKLEMQIHITQHIDVPGDRIGTNNAIVVESIKSGEPKGYSATGASRPQSEADKKVESLTTQLAQVTDENAALKARIAELEAKITEMGGEIPEKSKIAQNLQQAKIVDGALNNE